MPPSTPPTAAVDAAVAVARCDVVVIAVDRLTLRAWSARALDRAGLAIVHARDRGHLLDLLALTPAGLVLGDPFDRAPAEALLAMVRTAGSDVQALVLAGELRHRLLASARALAPIEFLREPALTPHVRGPRMSPRRRARTWMRRCVELAAPGRVWLSDVESMARR